MQSNVEYITTTTLSPLESKNASFNSNNLSINNNKNISLEMQIVSSSGLSASAKAQVSLDGTNWIDLPGTSSTITGDDDILWTISEVSSLNFIRISVTISAGSAIFYIIGRAV